MPCFRPSLGNHQARRRRARDSDCARQPGWPAVAFVANSGPPSSPQPVTRMRPDSAPLRHESRRRHEPRRYHNATAHTIVGRRRRNGTKRRIRAESNRLSGQRASFGCGDPGRVRSRLASRCARYIPYAGNMPNLRRWTARRTAVRTDETLLAKFADGPLSGTTQPVTAVEGRPPKTIDLDCGGHQVRYCLAEWEQSGHSAVYGFLYEV